MILNIKDDCIVYILAPSNSATGGPELLHQLAYKLRLNNIDARMVYVPFNMDDEKKIHKNYLVYNPVVANEVIDNSKNILIVPETRTYFLSYYSNVQKVIWWLSVDNYTVEINKSKNRLSSLLNFNKFFSVYQSRSRSNVAVHLVQSQYAFEFLRSFNIHNIVKLSDFLRDDFISMSAHINILNKEKIILYNPKKGIEYTRVLLRNYPHFNWLPLQNMTPDEVVKTMLKSMIYIDFGNHPGKDRLPRECAVLGCCIITGKQGSAANDLDVSIPKEYKFDSVENHEEIVLKISNIFENFKFHYNHFEDYRKRISNEESEFDSAIKQIFVTN
jgi:hypothetical protein